MYIRLLKEETKTMIKISSKNIVYETCQKANIIKYLILTKKHLIKFPSQSVLFNIHISFEKCFYKLKSLEEKKLFK